jgi:hypothetical protein
MEFGTPERRIAVPRRRFVAGALAAACAGRAAAQSTGELPDPVGRVILSVGGRIARANARDRSGAPRADFDRAMLDALGEVEIATTTRWHRGVQRFQGVSGVAVLAAAGADGEQLRAVALNDYAVTIPVDDFRRGRAILALRANGRDLSVREKGPVFVVYDFDRLPAAEMETWIARAVWQLRRLEVR